MGLKPLDRALQAELLAQELLRFAQTIREQSDESHTGDFVGEGSTSKSTKRRNHCTEETYIELARDIYRNRRRRDGVLPTELFGEPAWDMLLDLYIARYERREVSTTSLCIASGVPASTALRWITALMNAGLATRHDAPHDARVHYIRLSNHGGRSIRQYLRRIHNDRLGTDIPFMLSMQ
jgi:hypothetical protein